VQPLHDGADRRAVSACSFSGARSLLAVAQPDVLNPYPAIFLGAVSTGF
jgi:hypothetical protein